MKKPLLFISFLVFIFLSITTTQTIAQTGKAVSGAEVTGTFRDASGSEFRILALGKGKLRLAFSGVYPYKMTNGEMSANIGEASGEAVIAGDTAAFKPADTEQCTITLKFLSGGRLKVAQKGTDAECGFGANVSADGNYKKKSVAKPNFAAR